MRPLLLLGAGGHGRVVADLAQELGWTVSFLDDAWPDRTSNGPWPILGRLEQAADARSEFPAALVSVGDNERRLSLHRGLLEAKFQVPVLRHPSAQVSRMASLGSGTVVCPTVVVNAFATIGQAVILNTASSVDHDCRLADGVHVSPGAHLGGSVVVGECSWVGIGSSVREGVTIGAKVVVGAGAAVVGNLPDAVVARGVPARPDAPLT